MFYVISRGIKHKSSEASKKLLSFYKLHYLAVTYDVIGYHYVQTTLQILDQQLHVRMPSKAQRNNVLRFQFNAKELLSVG